MKNFDFNFLDDKQEVNFKLLGISFSIILMAFYIGFLIYGDRGLNRLIVLQNSKKEMKKAVEKLKQENVKLQKEYFGLKDIKGDE